MDKQISFWILRKKIESDANFTTYKVQHHKLADYWAVLKLANRTVPAGERQEVIRARVDRIVELAREDEHIVRYIDWGFHEEKLFLVHEEMNGITLRRKYRGRRTEQLPVVLAYLQQLKSILEKAHSRNVYHLDLRPENIWLEDSESGNGPELVLDGWKIGLEEDDPYPYQLESWPYLPPEADHPEELGKMGAASDVYQAALLVCELLTGHLPFSFNPDDALSAEIRAQHAMHEPVFEGIPPALQPTLRKALTKRVEDRYRDIGGFVTAFQLAYDTMQSGDALPEPVSHIQLAASASLTPAPASGQGDRRDRPIHRRTALKIVGGLLITTILVGTGTALYERSRSQVGTLVRQFKGHKDSVSSAVWSPGGNLIASGDRSGRIYVWDALTGALVQEFKRHASPIAALAWSPDGTRIASVDTGGEIYLWEVSSGELVYVKGSRAVFRVPGGETAAMVWSSSGEHLVVNGGGLIYVFDYPLIYGFTNPDRPAINGRSGDVNALSLSPDGQQVVVGYEDCVATVFSAEDDRQLIHRIYGSYAHDDEVRAVSWSPSGKLIASTSDPTVQLWSANNTATTRVGNAVYPFTFTGHSRAVNAIAFSYDGQRIASAGDDGTALIYDLLGNGRGSFTGHSGPINSLAWSPYPLDKYIATSSDDTTVCVWRASEN